MTKSWPRWIADLLACLRGEAEDRRRRHQRSHESRHRIAGLQQAVAMHAEVLQHSVETLKKAARDAVDAEVDYYRTTSRRRGDRDTDSGGGDAAGPGGGGDGGGSG